MIPVVLVPLVVSVSTGVATTGFQAGQSRARFPAISGLGRAARIIRDLLARGLSPAVTTGPFGNLVVGTEDQDLSLLAEEAAFRRLNQEVLAELLAEDPLLFIKGLPVGDPRRIAAGLDPPNVAVGPPPINIPAQRLPTTAPTRGPPGGLAFLPLAERRIMARSPPFATRALSGRAIR